MRINTRTYEYTIIIILNKERKKERDQKFETLNKEIVGITLRYNRNVTLVQARIRSDVTTSNIMLISDLKIMGDYRDYHLRN